MTEQYFIPDEDEDTKPIILPPDPQIGIDTETFEPGESSPETLEAEPAADPKSRDPIIPNVMVQVAEDAHPTCIAGRWGFTKNQLTGSENWVVKFEDGLQPLVWRGVEEKYLFRIELHQQ